MNGTAKRGALALSYRLTYERHRALGWRSRPPSSSATSVSIGSTLGRERTLVYLVDTADRTQLLLARAGLKGRPLPDLVIAAQAELAGLTVLHYDADFDLIASVTGQPTLWISRPGSID